MIVVWARDSPRSAIISTRSRKLSLYRRYQRTQRTMISRSKCRPLKISSTLNMPVSFTESYAGAKYAGLLIFAPQPPEQERALRLLFGRGRVHVTTPLTLFPRRSGHDPEILTVSNARAHYPAIRAAARGLLAGRHIHDVLAATYECGQSYVTGALFRVPRLARRREGRPPERQACRVCAACCNQ
jgi:hypothetical protein